MITCVRRTNSSSETTTEGGYEVRFIGNIGGIREANHKITEENERIEAEVGDPQKRGGLRKDEIDETRLILTRDVFMGSEITLESTGKPNVSPSGNFVETLSIIPSKSCLCM